LKKKALIAVAIFCLAVGIAGWFRSEKKASRASSPHPNEAVNPVPAPVSQVHNRRSAKPLPPELAEVNADTSPEDLLRLARIMVARSPEEALQWAQSQSDHILGVHLLDAVLRAWGEQDPRAAVDWVTQLDEHQRRGRMEAAFAGAATHPDAAAELMRKLLGGDPTQENPYPLMLMGGLATAGNFQTAFQFINDAPPALLPEWTTLTFNLWAQSNPDDAVKALNTMTDPTNRAIAFGSLVAGWAEKNPEGLAHYAASLPAGPDRELAFNSALDNWGMQDPASVGEWLNTLSPSPELDRAIAQLITRTDSVNRSPEVAMSWIASISDSTLRNDSLLHVMKEWTDNDPQAAWSYIKGASWINDSEREELQKKMIAAAQKSPEPD
jgi:hypothetical protein